MGVGQGQIQHVGVEIVSTGSATVLRIGDLQLTGFARPRVAQVVERPLGRPQPRCPLSTPRTATPAVIAGPAHDLWRGKILDPLNAFRGIGHIAAGAIHDHTSQRPLSWRYRPVWVLKVRKSSATTLQSHLAYQLVAHVRAYQKWDTKQLKKEYFVVLDGLDAQ
jgi:hypothetical protein